MVFFDKFHKFRVPAHKGDVGNLFDGNCSGCGKTLEKGLGLVGSVLQQDQVQLSCQPGGLVAVADNGLAPAIGSFEGSKKGDLAAGTKVDVLFVQTLGLIFTVHYQIGLPAGNGTVKAGSFTIFFSDEEMGIFF